MKRFMKPKEKLPISPILVENAEITRFDIIKGAVTFIVVELKFEFGNQTFQCTLGHWDDSLRDRVDDGFFYEVIECILVAAGVDRISKLVGRNVRVVKYETNGYIKGFGHIIRDEFFLVDDILKLRGSVLENKT